MIGNQQPAISNQQSAVKNHQSPINHESSATSHHQYITSHQQPAITNQSSQITNKPARTSPKEMMVFVVCSVLLSFLSCNNRVLSLIALPLPSLFHPFSHISLSLLCLSRCLALLRCPLVGHFTSPPPPPRHRHRHRHRRRYRCFYPLTPPLLHLTVRPPQRLVARFRQCCDSPKFPST